MPSQDRIPMFPNYLKHHHMDLKSASVEQGSLQDRSFVTQVHLTLRNKACYHELQECKQVCANKPLYCEEDRKDYNSKTSLGSYNAELISSILISQMIDKKELEDNRFLSPMYCGTKPNSSSIQQSAANHTSLGISSEFTLLPGKLDIQTPLDNIIHRANLYPTEEKQTMHKKKGFSSITITARRNITSLKHALKQIASDPASPISRNNDLLMKDPISPVEHDHKCRYFDNQERFMQSNTQYGLFNSNGMPRTSHTLFIPNTKNRSMSFCISYVYVRVNQSHPAVIYHTNKSLSLPIGKPSKADHRTYTSTISFKINCHSSKVDSTNKMDSTMLHRPDFVQSDSSLLIKKSKGQETVKGQPPSNIALQTNNSQLSALLTETVTTSKPSNECKMESGHSYGPCQDILNCLNTKGSSLQGVQKQDPITLCDIYSQKDFQPQDFSNLGTERSNITTFNFIFGRQITQPDKEKSKLQKENIPLNGLKQCNAYKKIAIYIKENMPLTTFIEKNIIIFHPGFKNKNKENLSEIMSLREALEHHRPDFISSSQERLHKLELMVNRRKIQQNQEASKSTQQYLEPRSEFSKRKMFTVPHPSSNNLFKPKERTISEREMHQRSKRIYNSLPEVKKKKEEEEKRMTTQSNRMKAELFKKKLLNQILQRTTDC
ncbi:(E2-independent) E3 ubiquitin-conjugating enzyme FATS [Pelodytes ibericus]